MTKILITGSTGFLGIPLTRKLSELGHNLKLLVRESSDTSPFEDLKNVEYVIGDVTDIDSLYAAVADDTEAIYHNAGYVKIWAKDMTMYDKVNIEGAENMAKVALEKDIPVYYTSSFGALGPNPDGQACDETYAHVDVFQNDYERTKFYGREKIKEYIEKGLKAIIFYPGFIYGPGDFNIYGEMTFDIVANQFLGCPGKGQSIFCMAYLDDVVNGMVNALGKEDLFGQGFFLGGENIKIKEYLDIIAELAGSKKIRTFPYSGGVLFAKFCQMKANMGKAKRVPYITPSMIVGMKYNWAFSSQSAIDKLGYKITPLREALVPTIQWYRDYIEKHGKKKKKVGIRCL